MHPPVDDGPLSPLLHPSFDDSKNEFVCIHAISKRILIGCVTALIYDILITADQSIAFSRSSPRSCWIDCVKILFNVYRSMSFVNFIVYFFVVEFLNPQRCDLLTLIDTVMYLNLAIVEVILLLRVWVLYEHSRVVGTRLFALAALGTFAIILVRILKPDAPIKCAAPRYPVRRQRRLTSLFALCPVLMFYEYAVIAIIHVISLSLVIWKSFRSWRASIDTPLVGKFIRDGVSYYLIVTAVFVVSIIAMTDERIVLPFMESYIVICLSSLACNRLLLNLSNSSHPTVSVESAHHASGYPLQTFHPIEADPSAGE